MKFFMIGPYYLNWHYTKGLHELSKNLWNFIVFQFNFFSVKELLFTLLSPFQRVKEDYGSTAIDFQKILSSFIINTIMRVVGFVVRSFILFFAGLSICTSFILFPVALLIWLALPFLLLMFIAGAVWAYIRYRI